MNPKDTSWNKIAEDFDFENYEFDKKPLVITATQIKESCKDFVKEGITEPRILCKQDTRESRPEVFKRLGLFILPRKNGQYYIIKGEGYLDIPKIKSEAEVHKSILDFDLETTRIGNSEMQHLDYAYASSIIRTFMNDPSLVLTIRGRKYTPEFSFHVGKHIITTRSVQTEVDGGYEGRDSIVLIEAKSSKADNEIIRQLYYPYRQWQEQTSKKVTTLFFQKHDDLFDLWNFEFTDRDDYNSIKLVKSARFRLK
jgi:hypothetical protein